MHCKGSLAKPLCFILIRLAQSCYKVGAIRHETPEQVPHVYTNCHVSDLHAMTHHGQIRTRPTHEPCEHMDFDSAGSVQMWVKMDTVSMVLVRERQSPRHANHQRLCWRCQTRQSAASLRKLRCPPLPPSPPSLSSPLAQSTWRAQSPLIAAGLATNILA